MAKEGSEVVWHLVYPFVSSTYLGIDSAHRNIIDRAYSGLNSPRHRVYGELVSVIIPTHNEEKSLPFCLTCLRNQTYQPLEVIVVDYESEDGTRNVAQLFGARVVEIDEPGIGNARDYGVKFAHGNYLFFTDADCVFENRLIEELAKDLENGWDCVSASAISYELNPISNIVYAVRRYRADWILDTRATLIPKQVWEDGGGWQLPFGEERLGRDLRELGYRIKMRRDLALITRPWYKGKSKRLKRIIEVQT